MPVTWPADDSAVLLWGIWEFMKDLAFLCEEWDLVLNVGFMYVQRRLPLNIFIITPEMAPCGQNSMPRYIPIKHVL